MDICVGNLASDVTGKDFREVFESLGRVETADVVRHRYGDKSGGLGFVGMPDRSDGTGKNESEQDHIHQCPLLRQEGERMKTRKTADRNPTRVAANDVQASSKNIIPLRGANSEKMKLDTSILKLRPAHQAAALTHDLIAERARAIWLEHGCSLNQNEENWREAEAQLKAEMGIG